MNMVYLHSSTNHNSPDSLRSVPFALREKAEIKSRVERLAPRLTALDRIEAAFWWVWPPLILGNILFALFLS